MYIIQCSIKECAMYIAHGNLLETFVANPLSALENDFTAEHSVLV